MSYTQSMLHYKIGGKEYIFYISNYIKMDQNPYTPKRLFLIHRKINGSAFEFSSYRNLNLVGVRHLNI